ELRLTPEVIAGIYLGRVSRWNDPAIAATNPGLRLPDREITVVYRSDGSGTTFVFTEYLSKISPEWRQQVGSSTAVRWPVGIGAKGNEGITGQIKQTPYAVGYVEHLYAEQNKLPVAAVRNAAGEFVRPSLDSITAAAAGAAGAMPEDLRVSITDAPGETAYPISSFTYLLVYRTQRDQAKGKALVAFLWWAVHEGERYAREMSYAPLPPEMVAKAEAKINSITFQGAPLRQ
ncbi:MAG TPA: phosphate ABC transporter substrate-binding protein PstS, partial [Blastocatellia bacterium]|nr:phosphate ABC transporter substrate-binding protein PstS [Blastocatellia bacterium]